MNGDASGSAGRTWLGVATLLVGTLLPPLDFFIVNLAIPSIQDELGGGDLLGRQVVASYAATYAATLVLGGRVGDLYGRQRVFLVGLIGFALASLLCGIAPAPAVLVVGRILQGVTAALMAPQSLALIRAGLTGRQQSIALGFHGAVFGLAAVLGQSLGGLLVAADAALWARYEVGPRIQEDKHFHHPDIGEIRLHFEKLTIESAPGQHLAVYTAEPGTAAADGLALLTSLAADGAAVDQPGVSEEWCNRS